jgi:hypothetical protein
VLVVMAACLAIPGPLDEAVVVPCVLAWLAARHGRELLAVTRAAWAGESL